MPEPHIALFGVADELSGTATVIREIADDVGHGRPPEFALADEISGLEAALDRLRDIAGKLGG